VFAGEDREDGSGGAAAHHATGPMNVRKLMPRRTSLEEEAGMRNLAARRD
jgi:hypothetical protein